MEPCPNRLSNRVQIRIENEFGFPCIRALEVLVEGIDTPPTMWLAKCIPQPTLYVGSCRLSPISVRPWHGWQRVGLDQHHLWSGSYAGKTLVLARPANSAMCQITSSRVESSLGQHPYRPSTISPETLAHARTHDGHTPDTQSAWSGCAPSQHP